MWGGPPWAGWAGASPSTHGACASCGGSFHRPPPRSFLPHAQLLDQSLWALPRSPILSHVPTLEGDDGRSLDHKVLGTPYHHLLPALWSFQTEGLGYLGQLLGLSLLTPVTPHWQEEERARRAVYYWTLLDYWTCCPRRQGSCCFWGGGGRASQSWRLSYQAQSPGMQPAYLGGNMPLATSSLSRAHLVLTATPPSRCFIIAPLHRWGNWGIEPLETCPTYMAKQRESRDSNTGSLAPGSVATWSPLAILPHLRQKKKIRVKEALYRLLKISLNEEELNDQNGFTDFWFHEKL